MGDCFPGQAIKADLIHFVAERWASMAIYHLFSHRGENHSPFKSAMAAGDIRDLSSMTSTTHFWQGKKMLFLPWPRPGVSDVFRGSGESGVDLLISCANALSEAWGQERGCESWGQLEACVGRGLPWISWMLSGVSRRWPGGWSPSNCTGQAVWGWGEGLPILYPCSVNPGDSVVTECPGRPVGTDPQTPAQRWLPFQPAPQQSPYVPAVMGWAPRSRSPTLPPPTYVGIRTEFDEKALSFEAQLPHLRPVEGIDLSKTLRRRKVSASEPRNA